MATSEAVIRDRVISVHRKSRKWRKAEDRHPHESWEVTRNAQYLLYSFANQRECRCSRSFRKQRRCMTFMYPQFNAVNTQWQLKHNSIWIIHPIGIYTHNAIGFVLKVPTATKQCICRVFFYDKIMVQNVIHITSEYEEWLSSASTTAGKTMNFT